MKERRARDRTFDPLAKRFLVAGKVYVRPRFPKIQARRQKRPVRSAGADTRPDGPFLRQDIAHPPDEPAEAVPYIPQRRLPKTTGESLRLLPRGGRARPVRKRLGTMIRMKASHRYGGRFGWAGHGRERYPVKRAGIEWASGHIRPLLAGSSGGARLKVPTGSRSAAGGKATTRARSAPGLRTRCAVHCSIGVRGDQVRPIKMRRVRPRGHIPMPDRAPGRKPKTADGRGERKSRTGSFSRPAPAQRPEEHFHLRKNPMLG